MKPSFYFVVNAIRSYAEEPLGGLELSIIQSTRFCCKIDKEQIEEDASSLTSYERILARGMPRCINVYN